MGLRGRDLDVTVLEAGPNPFKKLSFCALDSHGSTIQARQLPNTASSMEASTEPFAPIG